MPLGKCVRANVPGVTEMTTGSFCPSIDVAQRPNGDVWLTQDGKTIVVDPAQASKLVALLTKARDAANAFGGDLPLPSPGLRRG